MNTDGHRYFVNRPTLLAGLLLTLLGTGCAGTKTKALSERGWIGGQYVLAKSPNSAARIAGSPGVAGTLPKPLRSAQSGAIQITDLSTNAPAYAAGLRAGDFIVQVNQKPATSLQSFRRAIDRAKPGSSVTTKIYRDGQFAEYQVPVGREKYKDGGYFTISVPTVVHRWDLWPNPGFSLVCIGYEPNPGLRHEFGASAKAKAELYDENWSAYLVFMELSSGERVVAQEPVIASK